MTTILGTDTTQGRFEPMGMGEWNGTHSTPLVRWEEQRILGEGEIGLTKKSDIHVMSTYKLKLTAQGKGYAVPDGEAVQVPWLHWRYLEFSVSKALVPDCNWD